MLTFGLSALSDIKQSTPGGDGEREGEEERETSTLYSVICDVFARQMLDQGKHQRKDV